MFFGYIDPEKYFLDNEKKKIQGELTNVAA